MFFQIKMIRKGTKPPIWRRAYVPSNITFAQMALVLEELLEFPKTDRFEFEFYQKKDRLIEWHEEDKNVSDFYYTYLNAPDTYINDWFMQEKWFTFRIRGRNMLPEYRVEIEKALDDVTYTATGKKLNSPILLTEKSVEKDEYWKNGREINEIFSEYYQLVNGKAEYLYLNELREHIEKKREGLVYVSIMVNRNIHTKTSGDAMMREIADMVSKAIGMDEYKGSARDILYGNAGKQKIEEQVRQQSRPSLPKATVEGILSTYTKEELLEIAEEYGLKLKVNRKDQIAYQIARHMLQPEVMRETLFMVSTEELDSFEEAMKKGRYIPDKTEAEQLDTFFEKDYIAEFTDDTIEVPEEIKAIYAILKRTGYREFHRKMQWLSACSIYFEAMYAVAPIRVFYDMYKLEIKESYETFLNDFKKLPESRNVCAIIGNRMMSKQLVRGKLYKEIELRQRNVDYYLPAKSEILTYSSYGYPADEKAYIDLEHFFRSELQMNFDESHYWCVEAFCNFSAGGLLSHFIQALSSEGIEFSSEQQVKKFADIVMRVNNNTRMFAMRGHTPLEMGNMASAAPSKIPVMKFSQGLGGPMEVKEKKVYPNEPCPCGSGKKYKKCCGKNK